jgi:spermidine synthase
MRRASPGAGAPAGDEPTLSESDGIRYLHFGTEWIQGAMRVSRPAELVLAYTQQMMAWLLFLEPGGRDRVGILGLGAGSLLRYVLRHTRAEVAVAEWNPRVTQVCRAYFRLHDSPRLSIDHEDAALWLKRPESLGSCAALMVDLYDAQARGPVRDTLEFYQDCRAALAEVGVLTVNLFGSHESFPHNLANIREAFAGRVLQLPEVDEGNRVVLAFKGPLLDVSVRQFLDRAEAVQARYGLPALRWARSLLAGGAGALQV